MTPGGVAGLQRAAPTGLSPLTTAIPLKLRLRVRPTPSPNPCLRHPWAVLNKKKIWFLKDRPALTRLATSVCHDQMGQGPTEPHAGRSMFLLSSGGAGGRVLLSGR